MKTYTISLDIGGTSIKTAVLECFSQYETDLRILEDTYETYDAKSLGTKEDIISNLISVIEQQAQKIAPREGIISRICLAIPGPFDYEQGISYIKSLGKYDQLYGVNVKTELKNALCKTPFSENLQIFFRNDALAFAYGEAFFGQQGQYTKVACFTLGTGCGSTFLEHGSIVAGRDSIPFDGMIYHEPMRESIIDNYISRRYLLRLAEELSLDEDCHGFLDVLDIYNMALNGNIKASACLDTYGRLFASAIKKYIHAFSPDAILLGGGISMCYPLFQEVFFRELNYDVPVFISSNMTRSALLGAAIYLNSAP